MPNTKLLDVARHARVSPATVSRVLNKSAPVNGSTRTRVLEAIVALGYKPTSIPPLNATDQGTIALVITDILNPFFPEIVQGVEDEAGNSGLAMMLCNTSEDALKEAQALNVLAGRKVNGIIVCASRIPADDLITLHNRNNAPMVQINKKLDHADIPCIVVDFERAMYQVVQHVLSLQHTRIAYLAGHGETEPSIARHKGIEGALREAGLPLPSKWCPTSFPNVEGGFQAMSSLLALPRKEQPTAVIAYNDIMAIGALQAIRAHGMSVPGDISVVGCDGIAMAAHANPPLTTINQPKYRMGQLAMQMLRQMIEDNYTPPRGYTLMESPLVVRESTGQCRF